MPRVAATQQRPVGFRDGAWGAVNHAPSSNNGPSGKWVEEHVLRSFNVARSDCCMTDCINTARRNKGQSERIRETYEPAVAKLGLPAVVMEAAPVGEATVVREAKRCQLRRLSAELDAARPEVVITLGDAALRVLCLLVEIDSGDPGPALREESYGREAIVRHSGGRARWLPLVHPRPGSEPPSGVRFIHGGNRGSPERAYGGVRAVWSITFGWLITVQGRSTRRAGVGPLPSHQRGLQPLAINKPCYLDPGVSPDRTSTGWLL
jgi:hypothetical protein